MNRYTGPLSETTQELISQSKPQLAGLFGKLEGLKGLGRTTADSPVISIDESIERFNPAISENEIKAWIWYRREIGIPMNGWEKYYIAPSNRNKELNHLVKEGALFVVSNTFDLEPYPVFAYGNMYEKETLVKKLESYIVDKFGQEVYDNHLEVIRKARPKQLSITNPSKPERPRIKAISKLAQNYEIESLKDGTGVVLEGKTTLQEAFKDWLGTLADDSFPKSSAWDIKRYYLEAQSKPRNMDKLEWDNIEKNSRDIGEGLFQDFLHEALEFKDQQQLDLKWNYEYNGFASVAHHRIPIGIEVSRSFHGFEFDLRPAQREGVAFMELVGSGIIAYDVGVGKTITAICELANAMRNGKCSRPLVVVPNPTYKNWIKEMFGYTDGDTEYNGVLSGTDITLNDWYNLGTNIEKGLDLEKAVPENSITLVTYEGFMKIGFSNDVQSGLFFELSNILDQGKMNASKRDIEKRNEKYRELLGKGIMETIADIDDLKFDYLVIDEAHNFKNVFAEVKKDGDDKKRFHLKGGKPSNRAIKAFFLANYIQRTFGRNTMLLSATPFTNSPLEVYSMLSLVGYKGLKSMRLFNIHDFFEQFILETAEHVVKVDGTIQRANVVKSFENRVVLQKLIHNHINFKTGEEANIPRPCKVNIPKTSAVDETGEIKRLDVNDQILSYLQMTPRQWSNQQDINTEAKKGVSKDDPGALLRVMGQSLNNALSPFLYDNEQPIDYLEFVEESPKIEYALNCIKSVKQWHEKRNQPVSGQVIYIDRGKDYFPYIKEWLEKEAGYQRGVSLKANKRQKVDEVEIITSGISGAKKEKIKEAFLEGTCKIIIGTSTIREGINLQKNGTVLYNLFPNWNPTDVRQLEGRIWRQKNKFGYVRIVMPLMENSMDIFVFQKLEEKTSRINDIWSKAERGNVLDEESLDTNEVKFALITDLEVLAKFELDQESEQIYRDIKIKTQQLEDFKSFTDIRTNYVNQKKQMIERIEGYSNYVLRQSIPDREYTHHYIEEIGFKKAPSEKEFTKEQIGKWERLKRFYEQVQNILQQGVYEDKELVSVIGKYNRLTGQYYDWTYDRFKENLSKYKKLLRTVIEPRGYNENSDLAPLQTELEKELEKLNEVKEKLNSDDYLQELVEKIRERKAKMQVKAGTLEQRVKDFEGLNHLLSYKFKDVDHTSCFIPTKEFTGKQDAAKEVKNHDNPQKLKLAKAKAKAQKQRISILAMVEDEKLNGSKTKKPLPPTERSRSTGL